MRRIAVIAAVLSSWSGLPVVGQAPSATSDVAPATVVRVPSASLGREQVATILLPASYGTSRQRYPVVYLLHGGGQDHTAFATRGWFRALASRDMIVVTPSVGDSWYVNSVADASAKYEDFVVKDLIEYRGQTVPDHRIPRGPGNRGCLDGRVGGHAARLEAPSPLWCRRRVERPLRHFETRPEHGHDLTNPAALRCARNARASREGPRDVGVDDSCRVRSLALPGLRQSGHLCRGQSTIRRATDRTEDSVRIPRAVAVRAFVGGLGRTTRELCR